MPILPRRWRRRRGAGWGGCIKNVRYLDRRSRWRTSMDTPESQDWWSRVWSNIQEGALEEVKDSTKKITKWALAILLSGLILLAVLTWGWLCAVHSVAGWLLALPWVVAVPAAVWGLWRLALRLKQKPRLPLTAGTNSPQKFTVVTFRWQESNSKPVWFGSINLATQRIEGLRSCCPDHTRPVDLQPLTTGADGAGWSTVYKCLACGRQWDGTHLRPDRHREETSRTILAKWQAGALTLVEPAGDQSSAQGPEIQ